MKTLIPSDTQNVKMDGFLRKYFRNQYYSRNQNWFLEINNFDGSV